MMIALRRVRTPTAPIVKSTAESASDSASIDAPPPTKHYRPDDRHEQQNARQLECEEVLIEQRLRDAADRALVSNRYRIVAAARRQRLWQALARERHHLCEQREA